MIYESFTEPLLRFLRQLGRHYKLVITFVVLLVLLLLWINYKLVDITVVTKDKQGLVIAGYDTTTQKTRPVELHEGINLVSRNVSFFEIKTKKGATIVAERHIPIYSLVQSVEAGVEAQQKEKKLLTSSQNCPVLLDETFHSYNCLNPKRIFTHNTVDDPLWNSTMIEKISLAGMSNLVPYRDGLLGIWLPPKGIRGIASLSYVDIKKQTQHTIRIPEKFVPKNSQLISLTVDTTKQDGEVLLSFTKSNSLLVFNVDSPESSKQITLPEEYYSTQDAIFCSLLDRQASCYIGKSSTYLENPDAQKNHAYQRRHSYVYSFSLEGNNQNKKLALPANLYANHIYRLPGNKIYLQLSNGDIVEVQENGKLRLILRTTTAVAAGKTLYAIADNTLYKLLPNGDASQAVLGMDGAMTLSSLRTLNDQPLLSMLNNKKYGNKFNKTNYFYTTQQEVPLLPKEVLSLENSRFISEVDYQGNTIFLRLNTPVISDKQTGKLIVDTVEKARALDDVKKRLKRIVSDEAFSQIEILTDR